MKLKEILTVDMEKTRWGQFIIFTFVLLVAAVYLINWFSPRSKCERAANQKMDSIEAAAKAMGITQMALNQVRKEEVQKCNQ